MSAIFFGAFGLPGSALAISRIGKWIARRIRIYRNAPPFLEEMQKFGIDLCRGQLYMYIKLAEAALADSDDSVLAKDIRLCLEKLRVGLEEAEGLLAQCFDERGKLNDAFFATTGYDKLEKSLKKLRRWQDEFYKFMSVNDILRRADKGRILTHNNFMPSRDVGPSGDYCEAIAGTSYACVGNAEWTDSYRTRYDTPILFEKHDGTSFPREQIVESFLYLALHLPRNLVAENGILKCLGYRKDPRPELVFEVPKAYSKPRTLRDFLQRSDNASNFEAIPVEQRITIAYRISRAIFTAHRAGLLHKNVRPESILIFEDSTGGEPNDCGAPAPFLANWTLARTKDMLSDKARDDDWQVNLYRHFQRQGQHLEHRYHPGYDIYSLGVCLLEIGLGESLITSDDAELAVCELFQQEAKNLRYISAESSSKACENLKSPKRSRILLNLSQAELASRVGEQYSRIVRKCLECIESGLGCVQNFEDPFSKVDDVFRNEILEPLEKIMREGKQFPDMPQSEST